MEYFALQDRDPLIDAGKQIKPTGDEMKEIDKLVYDFNQLSIKQNAQRKRNNEDSVFLFVRKFYAQKKHYIYCASCMLRFA